MPNYTACVVSWPSPDGKQVDAFVRAPSLPTTPRRSSTWATTWFKTTREDHAATIGLCTRDQPAAPWYRDLHGAGPARPGARHLGRRSRSYLSDVMAGEYPPALSADDFHSDFLSERIDAKSSPTR